MDQRRQLLTFVLMLGFILVWFNVAPILFPGIFPQPKRPGPAGQAAAPAPQAAPAPAADAPPDRPDAQAQAPAPSLQVARFPTRTVVLGDPRRGYLQRLQLTTRGAAVEWQELTEPQYRTLDRKAQLRLLGNTPRAAHPATLAVEAPPFDALLQPHGLSLASVDWEFDEAQSRRIPDSDAWQEAVFRYPSPDGAWEAVKTFTLSPAGDLDPKTDPTGYLVDVTLRFRHLQPGPAELSYVLQGPTGLPLENANNTRIFRSVKGGTLTSADENSVSPVSLTAAAVVQQVHKAHEAGNPGLRPVWRYPVRWAGVDVQYFAALLIPRDNQVQDADRDGHPDAYFEEIVPVVLQEAAPVEQSDVSLAFKSRKFSLPAEAGSELVHRFHLYLGPKRVQLLDTFHAESLMDFGWFAAISRGMVALLNFFHNALALPYGLAIILLTVMVRGALFPLSRKQVANVQKMKDLNPKLQELKAKYGDDKEALARAQWEFMKKHGYNPLSGCLPIFLQLPIFIGLYNALNTAIDLRLARFLWINNLAAPDALFPLPFRVPFLGWTEFNLLPILTVALFIVQNKLFTPPPTNEEQAMQFKMMNFMMAVMGVMFYTVPAGLCVYFIASSLWGIAERKLLDRHKQALEAQRAASGAGPAEAGGGGPPPEPPPPPQPRQPGLWARLLEAADRAKHATNGQGAPAADRKARKGSKSKR